MHFAVIAKHIAIGADEHGRIVDDALHLLLGRQAKKNVCIQVAGSFGHHINGWAGHALGEFSKVQPIFCACGGQFGEGDQVELVFAGHFAHHARHFH